jgi:hypothetical protein
MEQLQRIVFALCVIAGTRKVTLETFYQQEALLEIAKPTKVLPADIGEQIRNFLRIEVATWNAAIWFKGVQLSVTQFRKICRLLLDLDGTGLLSRDRRLMAIRICNFKRCSWETWRSKGSEVKTGWEVEFLQIFAQHIIYNETPLNDVS